LGGDVKWKYIKELIGREKPRLLFMKETQLVRVNSSKCFNLCGSNAISWVHKGIDSEGGGILTMWDNKVFNYAKFVDEKGYVLVVGDYKCVASGKDVKVVIMNVYAPSASKEKVLLWREIEDVLVNVISPIRCVIGDFNARLKGDGLIMVR